MYIPNLMLLVGHEVEGTLLTWLAVYITYLYHFLKLRLVGLYVYMGTPRAGWIFTALVARTRMRNHYDNSGQKQLCKCKQRDKNSELILRIHTYVQSFI